MVLILVACVLVAVASLVCLVRFRAGTRHLGLAGVAGLGALADLTAVVASLMTAGGMLGQHMLHRGVGSTPALWVAGFCLLAQLVCMLVIRVATKPRKVPRHVDTEWAIPAAPTHQQTVLVYEVRGEGEQLRLEMFTPEGELLVLPTTIRPEACRELVGHRAVALVAADQQPVVLDLVDLGTNEDAPSATARPTPPAQPAGDPRPTTGATARGRNLGGAA